MSEIQSIAQNNYILATPQEVSHDSSLSGTGTVDSPLGVVPGYNETVLWSGASTVLNQTFNLSEPFTNFKKIRFKHCFEGSGIFVPIFTDYDTSTLAAQGGSQKRIGLSYNGCKAQNDLPGWNFGLANIVSVSNTELSGGGAGYFALNTKSLITKDIYYIYGIYGVDRISGGNA